MRVTDLFPPEVIDEDIRKMMGGAVLGASLMAATPVQKDPEPVPFTQEAMVLAQTIWGEARSHGREGMEAVGHVILNRANSGKDRLFGSGIEGVATKRKQFSCWNPGDPNRVKMEKMAELDEYVSRSEAPDGSDFNTWYQAFVKTGAGQEYRAWREAKQIARGLLSGGNPDPTGGALFYHTTAVQPSWATRMTPSGQIANHIFYRGPNQNSG